MKDSLHESIVVELLTDAWASVLADPDIPSTGLLDALAQRIPAVEQGAQALRLLVDDLMVSTAPETVRARAAQNQAAAAANAEAKKAWGRKLERRADIRIAGEAVGKCREGLTRAEVELARLTKSDAQDSAVVFAEGAVAMWTDRLTKASANLETLEKSEKLEKKA